MKDIGVTDDQDTNPYAPPASGPCLPPRVNEQQTSWLTVWCVVHVVIMAVALALETYQTETILGSGPVFAVVGVIIAMMTRRRRELEFYAGLSAPVFAAFIVVLINLNNWSPRNGGPPIFMLSSLYASVIIPGFFVAIVRQLRKHDGKETEVHRIMAKQNHNTRSRDYNSVPP